MAHVGAEHFAQATGGETHELVHVVEGGEASRHRVEELYALTVERHAAGP